MDEMTTIYCTNCEIDVRAKILEKFMGKTWTSIENLGKYGEVPTPVNHFERHGLVFVLPHKKGLFSKVCSTSNTKIRTTLQANFKERKRS